MYGLDLSGFEPDPDCPLMRRDEKRTASLKAQKTTVITETHTLAGRVNGVRINKKVAYLVVKLPGRKREQLVLDDPAEPFCVPVAGFYRHEDANAFLKWLLQVVPREKEA